MPRILYLLNISNPDKLASDSGWIVADILAPALMDQGADFVMAAPARVRDGRARFERTAVPVNKYRARLDPTMNELVALIDRTTPDVVVANQVEAATAVRAALLEAKSDALLAGYCHYLPFSPRRGQLLHDPALDDRGLGWPVLLTFAAGLAACDRILVHSATAATWVVDAAARAGTDITDRIRIVPPPRDERLVRDPAELSAMTTGTSLTGIYNHRLYQHYGTPRFVTLAQQLTARTQARLRVMDLFGSRSPERVALDDSPERMRDELAALPNVEVRTDRGDRGTYRRMLEECHFGFGPFRPGCPWAMSVIDCQGMGLPVIAPRMDWFAEHIAADLLFTTDAEAVALVERLACDADFYLAQAKGALASTAGLNPAVVAARYLEAVA
ncbi:glycosyltransferase family 1 protein [Streptomyces sp. NPDC047014]|uniref:glycosyltransferase family 1 protein n=1 Tax=Streptomyces sp. NPDC047014 TaxID=3155736 RepID=UPI0033CF9748